MNEQMRNKKPKWWQKKVRGWIVPFWRSDADIPLYGPTFANMTKQEQQGLLKKLRAERHEQNNKY